MGKENDNSEYPFIPQTNHINISNGYNTDSVPPKKSCSCCKCCHIPLFFCFLLIIGFFLFFLIFSLFIANYFMMKMSFDAINNNYFSTEIIDPIINRNANFTQSFNARIKVLDEILLESKLYNMKYAIEFASAFENKTKNNITEIKIKQNGTNDLFPNDTSKDASKDASSKQADNFFVHLNEKSNNKKMFEMILDVFNSFKENMEEFFGIEEFSIFHDKGDYLTYCKNWSTQHGYFSNFFFSLKQDDFKKFKGDSGFTNYIVINQYDINSYLNYIKFYTFTLNSSTILLGIRMKSESINSLYNKQNGNVTLVIPIYKNWSLNEKEVFLYPSSSYMFDFLNYGTSDQSLSEHDMGMSKNLFYLENAYQKLNLKTFLNTLYMYDLDNNKNTYNYQYLYEWKKEFTLIGQIAYNATDDKSLLPDGFNCGACNKKDDSILCDICVKLGHSQFDMNLYKMSEYNGTDESLRDFYDCVKNENSSQLKYHNPKVQLNNSIFTNKNQTKTPTKTLIYSQISDNLKVENIEIMDSVLYSSIKEDFITSMEGIEKLSNLILLIFCILAFILSMIFLGLEINKTTKRIQTISKLKDLLFCKKDIELNVTNSTHLNVIKMEEEIEDSEEEENEEEPKEKVNENIMGENEGIIYNNENDEVSSLGKNKDVSININDKKEESFNNRNSDLFSTSSNKHIENSIERWNKKNIYQKNFFEDGNKLIVNFTYNQLVSVMNKIDNYSDKKFGEKLRFLRRKYKLNKEQEGKKDCQLASDIYQAISKIDMLKLHDVSYNVHYDPCYAFNHSFRMFKSILLNTENKKVIPLRNNKFTNFEDILKIIYHIKKDKIQLLVNNIFEREEKKRREGKLYTYKSSNNEINFVLPLKGKKDNKKEGKRVAFDDNGNPVKKGNLKKI